MKNIKVYIKFFGSFKKFGHGLKISVKEGSSILEIKKYLNYKLQAKDCNLVEDSVLANDHAILQDNFIVNEDIKLSILPPVCGG